MQYISYYHSPLGKILLAADQTGITGAWFEDQKYYAHDLDSEHTEKDTPVLEDAKRWLDLYFSGKEPDFMPFRKRAGLHAAAPSVRHSVPEGGMGHPPADPLRDDHDLRGNRERDRPPARVSAHVGAGGWRRGRAQPGLHPDPLPPRRRLRWKPDRVCRRDRSENQAAGSGGGAG